jgi:hypothetical protein
MNSKDKIHSLLRQCCDEVLVYVQEREPLHADRWVPAAEVKTGLDLNFVLCQRAQSSMARRVGSLPPWPECWKTKGGSNTSGRGAGPTAGAYAREA